MKALTYPEFCAAYKKHNGPTEKNTFDNYFRGELTLKLEFCGWALVIHHGCTMQRYGRDCPPLSRWKPPAEVLFMRKSEARRALR